MGDVKLGTYCSEVLAMIGLEVSSERGVIIGPLEVVEIAGTVLELPSTVWDTTTFPHGEGSSLGFGRGIAILPLRNFIH